MLIVIGIIMILIVMSVPLISAITGSRSVESARNQVQALLVTARTEAMQIQKYEGILFFTDTSTDRIKAAFVYGDEGYDANGTLAVFLTTDIDREATMLTKGVSIEGINPAPANTATRYVGLYPFAINGKPTSLPIGCVILFDGRGQLVSMPFYLQIGWLPDPTTKPTQIAWLPLGKLLYIADYNATYAPAPTIPPGRLSQVGLTLFDRENFRSLFGKTAENADTDPQATWIDSSSVPLLVNCYNGTLNRGE